VEPFEIEPMAMIQAQQQRIVQLTNENVQLTAALAQLQNMVKVLEDEDLKEMEDRIDNGQPELDPDAREYIKDVTDQVVGAEMDPKVAPFVGEPGQREHKAEITS
jgi:hypothetical protein